MNLNEPVDQYCERLGPGLFAEPLNALSNLAFLVAGIAILRAARRAGSREAGILGWMVVAVAIGSGLFHTFATRWAMIADVAPIGVALVYFLWIYLRTAAQATLAVTLKRLRDFGLATVAFMLIIPKEAFNGTNNYFSCLVALHFITRHAKKVSPEAARFFAASCGTFAFALVCRSVDLRLCADLAAGTHYLWHAFNGLTLWLVAKGFLAVVGSRPPPP